jgi:hypothetical protein
MYPLYMVTDSTITSKKRGEMENAPKMNHGVQLLDDISAWDGVRYDTTPWGTDRKASWNPPKG